MLHRAYVSKSREVGRIPGPRIRRTEKPSHFHWLTTAAMAAIAAVAFDTILKSAPASDELASSQLTKCSAKDYGSKLIFSRLATSSHLSHFVSVRCWPTKSLGSLEFLSFVIFPSDSFLPALPPSKPYLNRFRNRERLACDYLQVKIQRVAHYSLRALACPLSISLAALLVSPSAARNTTKFLLKQPLPLNLQALPAL